jgi:hypothetical protein
MSILIKGTFDPAHLLMAKLQVHLACLATERDEVAVLFDSALLHVREAIRLNPANARGIETRFFSLFDNYHRRASASLLNGFATLFDGLRTKISETVTPFTREQRAVCGRLAFYGADAVLKTLRHSKDAAAEHSCMKAACERFTQALALEPQLKERVLERAAELGSPKQLLKLSAPLLDASMLYSVVLAANPFDRPVLLRNAAVLLEHASRSGDNRECVAEAGKCLEHAIKLEEDSGGVEVA